MCMSCVTTWLETFSGASSSIIWCRGSTSEDVEAVPSDEHGFLFPGYGNSGKQEDPYVWAAPKFAMLEVELERRVPGWPRLVIGGATLCLICGLTTAVRFCVGFGRLPWGGWGTFGILGDPIYHKIFIIIHTILKRISQRDFGDCEVLALNKQPIFRGFPFKNTYWVERSLSILFSFLRFLIIKSACHN